MKSSIFLSMIIPTLEEEKYLPLLLDSIKRQNLSFQYEIIIADAGSKDKTIEIAEEYGCKIVKGGLPAKGRNEGAKIARGELILFIDADVILPDNSLKELIEEFEKRHLDIAGFLLQPCGDNVLFKLLYNLFYNLPVIIMETFLSHSAGAILVKLDLSKKLDGFEENIKVGEDNVYSRKASRYGKFGILKIAEIYYSQRRYKRDGIIRSLFQLFLLELHLVFLGPIKSNIFNYDLHTRFPE